MLKFYGTIVLFCIAIAYTHLKIKYKAIANQFNSILIQSIVVLLDCNN